MATQTSLQPPRTASWLLDLVSPFDEAESIAGDLLEEYSVYRSDHQLAAADRWYWRQVLRTIFHLMIGAWRTSTWSIGGSVIVGILLLWFSYTLPERFEFAILNWNHMYHIDWYRHVSWMEGYELLIGHLLLFLLIGFIVGLLAKGNELVAAVSFSLLLILIGSVELHFARAISPFRYPWVVPVLCLFEFPIMVILGSGIVRDIRLGKLRSRLRV
jgi:hypothetical protein